MKKIYAFIATAIVATSLFYVQKNGSEYLFDANVEALARGEVSRGGCFDYCHYWFGSTCPIETSEGDEICEDMEEIKYGFN